MSCLCLETVAREVSVGKPTDSSSQEAECFRNECSVAWSFMLFCYFFSGDKYSVLDVEQKTKGFLSGFYNNNAYSLPQITEYGPAQERQPQPGSPIFN